MCSSIVSEYVGDEERNISCALNESGECTALGYVAVQWPYRIVVEPDGTTSRSKASQEQKAEFVGRNDEKEARRRTIKKEKRTR